MGNYDAMGMNALVQNVLKGIGINPERFSLQWASAAEAPRFVKLITEFTAKIKELGPLGVTEGIAPEELKSRLEKGLAAVSSKKVRMVYGTTAKSIRKDNIFTQEYISGVIEEKLSKAVTGALTAEAEEEEGEPADRKKAVVTEAKKASPKKSVTKKAAVQKKTAAKKKPVAKKAGAFKKAGSKKAAIKKKK